MVGADLANLVNEAALLAARRGHQKVNEADFTDALERIVLGAERKVMLSPDDRRRTAYHEGGHAIAGMLTEGADPVRKISIIPRGVSLGVTFSAPDADRFNYERGELIARVKVPLGGRAAEEIDGEISPVPSPTSSSSTADRPPDGRALGAAAPPFDRSQFFPLTVPALFPVASEVSERTRELIDERNPAQHRRGSSTRKQPSFSVRTATSSTRSPKRVARKARDAPTRTGHAGRRVERAAPADPIGLPPALPV
jgi:cell division protease FtsH